MSALSFFHMRNETNDSRHPFQCRITESPRSGSVQQAVTHQPAISFSISFHHPFNRAGGRTSYVAKIFLTMTRQTKHALRAPILAAVVLLSSCAPQLSTNSGTELPPFSGKLADDYKRIQGSWIVTSNEIRKQSLPQMAGAVFYFSGNQHWITGDKGREWFALDENHSPKAIDFYDKKAQSIRGIYKIEGDRLTLCTAALGYPRPKEFSTSPFTGTILTTTQRQ